MSVLWDLVLPLAAFWIGLSCALLAAYGAWAMWDDRRTRRVVEGLFDEDDEVEMLERLWEMSS